MYRTIRDYFDSSRLQVVEANATGLDSKALHYRTSRSSFLIPRLERIRKASEYTNVRVNNPDLKGRGLSVNSRSNC